MDHGRLLIVDAPDVLRAQSAGSLVEILARPRRRAVELLRARSDVGEVEVFGERLHVTLADEAGPASQAAARLADELRAAGIAVEGARPTTPSLEDIFIRRVSRDAPRGWGTT